MIPTDPSLGLPCERPGEFSCLCRGSPPLQDLWKGKRAAKMGLKNEQLGEIYGGYINITININIDIDINISI